MDEIGGKKPPLDKQEVTESESHRKRQGRRQANQVMHGEKKTEKRKGERKRMGESATQITKEAYGKIQLTPAFNHRFNDGSVNLDTVVGKEMRQDECIFLRSPLDDHDE